MERNYATAAAILFACAVLWPKPDSAEGALAVGLPPDVAKLGFAYGYTLDQSSTAEASATALKDCRKENPGVDKRAQAFCKVVRAFHNECFAVAMDPKDATPGVGWAIAPDKTKADSQALANCQATAGSDRRDKCEVTHSACDGSAK
jgi:hypothetical protein